MEEKEKESKLFIYHKLLDCDGLPTPSNQVINILTCAGNASQTYEVFALIMLFYNYWPICPVSHMEVRKLEPMGQIWLWVQFLQPVS